MPRNSKGYWTVTFHTFKFANVEFKISGEDGQWYVCEEDSTNVAPGYRFYLDLFESETEPGIFDMETGGHLNKGEAMTRERYEELVAWFKRYGLPDGSGVSEINLPDDLE